MGFPAAGGVTKRRATALILAVVGVFGVVACIFSWEPLLAVFEFWPMFLIPSVPVCLLVWFFGRKRVQWNGLDFLILVVPYLAWMLSAAVIDRPKSMSNIVELLYLGLAAALVPIIRLVVPKAWNGKVVAMVLLIAICVVAVGLYLFLPCLPE